MSELITIKTGGEAKSDTLNSNFQCLNEKIVSTNQRIETVNASIKTIQSTINNSVNSSIDEITTKTRGIGDPIFRLSNVIYDDEVRLEGDELSITEYPLLYSVYGDTYGVASSGKFKLPDFRNRTIWGGTTFGYLEDGLPDIIGAHTGIATSGSGVFSVSVSGDNFDRGDGGGVGKWGTINFNASSTNEIYGNSDKVQPASIIVRVLARYK